MSAKVEQNQKVEEAVVVNEKEQATQMVEVRVEPKKKFLSKKTKTGLIVGGVGLIFGAIGYVFGFNKGSKSGSYYNNETIIEPEIIETDDETIQE